MAVRSDGRVASVDVERVAIADIDLPSHTLPPTKGLLKNQERLDQLANVILARRPDGRYRVVAGERRVVALAALGREEVLARVIDPDPVREAEIRLSENGHRTDNPMAEAEAYELLLSQGRTQREIAELLGINRSEISQRLRLLDLIPALRERLREGRMSSRAGYYAAQLSRELQEQLAQAETITVEMVRSLRKTERLATMDLGSIDIPPIDEQGNIVVTPTTSTAPRPTVTARPDEEARELATRLRAFAARLDGAEKVALLTAAQVLSTHSGGQDE